MPRCATGWARFSGFLICVIGLLAAAVAGRHGLGRHRAEYYALLLAAAAGMVFLVTATNLMTLFLGLEWFSIALYVLCAYDVGVKGSLEAGLKYLVVGGFGSAVLLFGSAFVYGATGELGFSEIAAATAQQGLGDDLFLLAGLAMIIVGLGVQGLRRAVPHVDAGRLRRGSHAGHGLHGRGHEGDRARARAASPDDGVPG